VIAELNCCRLRACRRLSWKSPARLYSITQFEKSDIIIIIENENHYREEAAKLIELIKKNTIWQVSEAKHERTT
jgi:hypothetical protein